MSDYCAIVTTCGTREDAEALADALLDERLAACVQLLDIASHYRWQGKIARDRETLLLIKSRQALYPRLEAAIRRLHKYDVPEIVQLPIDRGLPEYLRWIDESTE